MSRYTQTNDFSPTLQASDDQHGPQNLSPYVMLGFPTEIQGSVNNITYRKNLGPDASEEIGKKEGPWQTNGAPHYKTFLKRAAIFVQPLKLEKDGKKNCPQKAEEWSTQARNWDNADKIYYEGTLLLDFDTMALYEYATDTIAKLSESTAGGLYDPQHYTSPARGIPVRFQKIFFYGTQRDVGTYGDDKAVSTSVGWEGPSPGTLGPKGPDARSDGRGSLFSAQVLIADPINLGAKYDRGGPESQSEIWKNRYDGAGNSLYPPQSAKVEDGYWQYQENVWTAPEDQYHKGAGMSSSWENNAFGNAPDLGEGAPLVLGDGAMGYVDKNPLAMFENFQQLYSIYGMASQFFRTEVALCVASGTGHMTITGFIPFQPHPSQSGAFNALLGDASGKLPIVYDIINPAIGTYSDPLPYPDFPSIGSEFSVVGSAALDSEENERLSNLEPAGTGTPWGSHNSKFGMTRSRIMKDIAFSPGLWSGIAQLQAEGYILYKPPTKIWTD